MQIIDIKAETINPSHKSKTLKLEQNGKKKKGGDDQNKTQRISEKKKKKKEITAGPRQRQEEEHLGWYSETRECRNSRPPFPG